MRMHRDAVKAIRRENIDGEIYDTAWKCWCDAVDLGEIKGYRNAQASVLRPPGTIGFMMDCDTTASNRIWLL
jgi:ribonucleoside-diphosphate reductase alpha chain